MIGKEWIHPRTGEKRYYLEVRDAACRYGGMELGYYNSGNLSWASIDGVGISNSEARRILAAVSKIWLDEEGRIHMDVAGDRYVAFWTRVADGIRMAVRRSSE